MLPWQTNNILVKCDQPPEKPYSAAFYRDLPSSKTCEQNVTLAWKKQNTAKCGKSMPSMVVKWQQKSGVVYYRGFSHNYIISRRFRQQHKRRGRETAPL